MSIESNPVTDVGTSVGGTSINTNAEAAASNWNSLYKLGGAAALVAALVYVADIIITFLPGWAPPPGSLNVTDWFALLQGNAVLGLRTLGFGNTVAMVLMVPMLLALYAAHRRVNQSFAALAMVFCFIGTAVYISNNPAVPMYVLSGKYAAATTDAKAFPSYEGAAGGRADHGAEAGTMGLTVRRPDAIFSGNMVA